MDNISARVTEHGDYGYSYDDLYRLTGVDNPKQADEGFSYDAVGNRLTAEGVSGEWSYNDNNELQGYAVINFEYDENGNMTQKTEAGQVTSYIYNVEDCLERAEDGSGFLISQYYYDPFGRRLCKEVGGIRTNFAYGDEGLVAEVDAAGNVVKSYGYRPGSTWTTDPLFMKVGGSYSLYQNDHLGTPQQLTAVNGAVVWSAKYNSFGQAIVEIKTIENNLRFAGQYYDQETGLHYNYHRYYDPTIGRYLRADPIGLIGGINVFSYAQNNPTNKIDPEGLKTIKGPNFTCYSGPPRVVVTTNTVTREKEIFSFKMLHPEGYRPSVGGNLPGHGRPPIGPEIAVDWWLWEHAYKEFSIFEITKTVSIFTYTCVDDRENACETSDAFRWEYEQEEVNETERLIDQYRKWINRKLYKAGSNSWPLP